MADFNFDSDDVAFLETTKTERMKLLRVLEALLKETAEKDGRGARAFIVRGAFEPTIQFDLPMSKRRVKSFTITIE